MAANYWKKTFRNVARPLRSERGVSLIVVLMLTFIILAMTGAGMFFSSIDLRASGNFRNGTQAFFAADTGINYAFSRIGLDPTTSTAAFGPITLTGGLKYCSGSVAATGTSCTGQALSAPKVVNMKQYNLAIGTVYNQGGYQAYQYKMNVTGVGQLSAAREVEAQIVYGPVPN
jgi:Tfp pilus assembly protein PilX